MLASCSKKTAAPDSYVQTGVASWYGRPFDGRLTASGEVYDMEKMTAAHRTLPFGAMVRVENLVNGKKTEVRITDRGPFVKDRIIDLSHAGAQAIDMPGIANVRLEVISTPATRGLNVYAVQVGNFTQKAEAERLRQQMQEKYGSARLVLRPGDQTWRVLVGMEQTLEAANALAEKLDKEAGPAFVVLADSEP
jgi:rare lipoprotein A